MATPAPSVVSQNEALQEHLDAMTRMRQAGATQDEVNQYYAQQTTNLRKAGIGEDEIRAYYGGQDPTPMSQEIQQTVQQNQAAGGHESWLDLFAHGLTNSSGAALLGVKPTPYQGQGGVAGAVASALGETAGDLPASIVGAFVQGKATASVLARTPLAEAAPEAIPVAAGLTGAFQAGATPTMIKAARDQWLAAGNQGWNAFDFLQAHGVNAAATVEAGKVGLASTAAGGAGGLVERALARAGVSGLAASGAKVVAESTAFTAATATLHGQMPTAGDWVEGTLIMAAAHGANHLSGATMRAWRGRLQDYYSRTGVDPQSAARAATNDPVLMRQLAGDPSPRPPPGSSRTPTGPEHPALNPAGHPQPDQFVVPRVAGNFDTAVNFTLQHEGGAYVIDANQRGVKWGINAADHPGVDIKNLSREGAAEIYKAKYWDAIGADRLPPNLRLAAFDTAVVEGVPRAKQWLSESGGDPQVFLGKRAAWEASLAQRDPARYGRFVKAWGNRLRDLGGSADHVGMVDRDPTDPMSESERALLDNEGQPPPPTEPPEPPDRGEPGDDDFEKRIEAHTSEDDQPSGGWLSGGMDVAKRLYMELFNPEHPIRRLVNAASEGAPLDDMSNPVMLRRLAERSQDDARYNINGDGHGNPGHMTDMEGNITGRSLKSIIEAAGDDKAQKQFLRVYAVSRWAQMMHAEGKDTGLDGRDVDRAVAQHGEKYEGLFQELVGWRNGTLGWLKGGVISEKLHDQLVSDKEAAIPGYRQMDNGKYGPATQPAKGNVFNPVKGAKGSERQLLPIEQSLMREAMMRRMLAATNRSNAAVADLGAQMGVATEKRAVDFNVVKTLAELSHLDAGNDIEGIDDMMSQLARSAGSAVPKDQMPVMRDGKMYGVKFSEEYKDVVPVVRGFDQGTRSLFFKIAAKVTSVPRVALTTANPLFAPHILGLDVMFQSIVNPDAGGLKGALTNLVTGFGAAASDPAGYDKWLRQGGAEHVFDHMAQDTYLKSVFAGDQHEGPLAGVWNAPQSAMHALQAWNRMNFAAMRYGRYVQGLKAGESDTRAAVASTESAYHRIGFGGPVGKAINAVIPFTGAHLNGLEKTVRSLLGGAPEALTGGKLQNRTVLGTPYSFKQTAIHGLAMLTVPAMLSWLAFKDQEWYKAMPDWQKNNAWFVIPPIDGKTPPIPFGAPPILSALFVGLPRMLGEAFVQDNPHAFDHWGASAGASLLGPVTLPIASFLQPVIEHVTNHSFFRDQPLASPDAMKTVGTPEQFNHYSSAEAKGLSRLVGGAGGLSPVVIDNYIHSWGGLPGALTQEASNAVADHFNVNKRPEQMPWEMAPFSSYIQRYPSASAQPIVDFYNRSNQLDSVHGSMVAAMRESDLGRFTELAKGDPSAAAYHMLRLQSEPVGVDTGPYMRVLEAASSKADWQDINLIREGQRAMKAANAYLNNSVLNNPRLTAQDKRQMMLPTYQKMQAISEQINDAMDRAGIGGSHPSSHQAPAPGAITFQQPGQ